VLYVVFFFKKMIPHRQVGHTAQSPTHTDTRGGAGGGGDVEVDGMGGGGRGGGLG